MGTLLEGTTVGDALGTDVGKEEVGHVDGLLDGSTVGNTVGEVDGVELVKVVGDEDGKVEGLSEGD